MFAIIGAGNVACILRQPLEDAGHTVTEVYARTLKSASKIY